MKAAQTQWDHIQKDAFIAPVFTSSAPLISMGAANALSQTYSASALLGK
jgi:hypothetical protein